MSEKKRRSGSMALKAETARQQQAQVALDAARGVLAEIEALAAARRRGELDEASGRFCNLVALSLYHSAGEVAGAFDEQLKAAVDELRGRLLDMGTNMLVDKIRRVHQRAAGVLRGGGYPLGLAESLRHSLDAVLDNLQLLGALEGLSAEERTLIEQTRAAVAQLAEFEARYGIMVQTPFG